jgi:hypothetical protein
MAPLSGMLSHLPGCSTQENTRAPAEVTGTWQVQDCFSSLHTTNFPEWLCLGSSDHVNITLHRSLMHCSCVQERLDKGNIFITLEIFRTELARIWSNARHYNGEDTIFAKAANQMDRIVDEHFMSTLHYHKAV